MEPHKQDAYAQQCARFASHKAYRKLPSAKRSSIDAEDIEQDMMVNYLANKHLYKPELPFKPWVHSVMNLQTTIEVQKHWDGHHKDKQYEDPDAVVGESYNEEGVCELVLMDTKSPDMVYVAYMEEAERTNKMHLLVKDVKGLCERFEVEFDKENVITSLCKVLDKTLNKMTSEEFMLIPYGTRLALSKYGAALEDQSLQVTLKGKIRSKGIGQAVRTLVVNGVTDFEALRKELDDRGMTYNPDSLRTIRWSEMKRAGLAITRKKTGIMFRITQLFDEGRGIITAAEMVVALDSENRRYAQSTVRSHVQTLRQQYGLTNR